MNELIGFIVLADAGRFAMTRQILGSLHHRDKSPVNALLAKAVQICEERRFSHLIYASWVDGTLGDFKRHNGFQKVDLPRYYIPLTLKGELALRGHLHHGIKGLLPVQVVNGIKALRHHYYDKRGWLYKTTCGQSSR